MGNAALLQADLLGHSPPVAGARTGAGAWAGGIPSDRYTAWLLDIESRILQVRILQVSENNPPPLGNSSPLCNVQYVFLYPVIYNHHVCLQ
jgi:hypothetical protein